MVRILAATLIAVLLVGGGVIRAEAQTAGPRDPAELREQVNQGTVGLISGGVNGTYIRIAADLANVLDDGDNLRILPIIGKGSVQNITDILYLRGIDIGIVQSDVLAYIRSAGIHPTIERRIRYITKLYNEEFHLLAAKGVNSVEDLAGKKVNFGPEGSGTYMTSTIVFDALGVDVEPVTYDYALALEMLTKGDIAGMVYVAGKPTDIFSKVPADAGVRFLPIPLNDALLETYLPSQFSHDDYPDLVDEGQTVDTIAIGAVMAVYNWNPQRERYKKVANFVRAFFDNFEEFLQPPRHAKWQEVNLAAVVPGWTRFGPAQEWLDERPRAAAAVYDPELRADFEGFLEFMSQSQAVQMDNISDAEREALFEQFLNWRERQGGQSAASAR